MCLAYKMVSEEEYKAWATEYNDASSSLVDRENKMDLVSEKIESDLILIGATAIEDRLQDGVPECIAKLAKAGIKIWVLTGDKMETAINIGFSCNLLTRAMTLIIVKGTDFDSTKHQLDEALEKFFSPNAKPKPVVSEGGTGGIPDAPPVYALIIDGQSLKSALDGKLKATLVDLACRCKAVICCRVSPLQKAQVVGLIKTSKKAMTLAIGDGANDVSMIQEANIGVGISGQEGMQATMASDYAVAQFKYLNRLLLVHGRWAYFRTAEMTLLMFYKNMIWTVVLFWFQIYCQFSAQIYYDYMFITLYNLIFTSLPPIILGFLDQDLNDRFSLAFPEVYKIGIRRELYGLTRFFIYMFDGFYQSLAVFYISYFVAGEAAISIGGYNSDLSSMGTLAAAIAVLNANNYMGLCMLHWTWLSHFVIWGSSLVFFLVIVVYAYYSSSTYMGITPELYATGTFWLSLPLSIVVCLLPRYLINFLNRDLRPTDVDLLREVAKYKTPEWDIIKRDLDPEDLKLLEGTTVNTEPSKEGEQIEMQPIGPQRSKPPGPLEIAQRLNSQFDQAVLDPIRKNFQKATALMSMRTGKARVNTGFAFAQEPGVVAHMPNLASPTAGSSRRNLGQFNTLGRNKGGSISQDIGGTEGEKPTVKIDADKGKEPAKLDTPVGSQSQIQVDLDTAAPPYWSEGRRARTRTSPNDDVSKQGSKDQASSSHAKKK